MVFEKVLKIIRRIKNNKKNKKEKNKISPNCVLGFEAEEKTGGEVFDVVHTPGGKQHGQKYHYNDDDDDIDDGDDDDDNVDGDDDNDDGDDVDGDGVDVHRPVVVVTKAVVVAWEEVFAQCRVAETDNGLIACNARVWFSKYHRKEIEF